MASLRDRHTLCISAAAQQHRKNLCFLGAGSEVSGQSALLHTLNKGFMCARCNRTHSRTDSNRTNLRQPSLHSCCPHSQTPAQNEGLRPQVPLNGQRNPRHAPHPLTPSLTLVSAPRSSRSWITATEPLEAAKCSGVLAVCRRRRTDGRMGQGWAAGEASRGAA